MTFCLALLLAMSDDLPLSLSEPEPEPAPPARVDSLFLRLRGGIWASRGLDFDATTVFSTQLRSKSETLSSAGIDFGASIFSERVVVFGSLEASIGGKMHSESVGACIGYRDWSDPGASPGVPQEAMIYAGPIFGRFDITTAGFGDFDRALGARAGISFTWKLNRTFGVSLAVEYRYLKFDYKDKSTIVSGDTSIGGSGVWAGLGLDLRF
jgi:hypothetical protein